MLVDTEGIVLRQVKTSYNRKMVLLFSKRYGKISAGTDIGEKGRSKSALAIRPFTYGRYEMFKTKDHYNINTAETIRSYYGIGEDVDKYMNGAYVLEFTEKVLQEEVPSIPIFRTLIDFFDILERRDKGVGTLVLAYQTKVFRYLGIMPQLDNCVFCGEKKPAAKFSIPDGGIVCEDCCHKLQNSGYEKLIYDCKFGIVDVFKYFAANSLKKLEDLALKEDAGKLLQSVIRDYAAYHLDASNLKSESLV
jgi:DNA repair protein RecO (recombination protein O)